MKTYTKSKLLSSMIVAGAILPVTVFAFESDQNVNEKIELLSKEIEQLKSQANKQAKKNSIKVGLERAQFDYNQFDGAYNSGNNGKTASDIFTRRARVYAKSKIEDWSYSLLTNFSESGASIVFARVIYSGFENGPKIKVGKIREDISLEALTSSKYVTTISRSMLANTLSPFFNYGVSAYQTFKDSGLRYAVGIYKGNDFGTDGFDKNDSLNLSLTGRLTWTPINNKNETLHFGSWYSKRDFEGDKLSARFARAGVRTTNVRLLDYAAGGSTVALDSMDQYGFEFAGVYGPLSLQAEYGVRKINAVDSANDDTFDGYYVMASYFVTGEKRKYKSNATFGAPTINSTSGAVELYARYGSFDATSELQGTKVDVLTIGASYYLNKKVKLMVNYLDSDVSGPGSTALVGEHTDGNALTARLQYLF